MRSAAQSANCRPQSKSRLCASLAAGGLPWFQHPSAASAEWLHVIAGHVLDAKFAHGRSKPIRDSHQFEQAARKLTSPMRMVPAR